MSAKTLRALVVVLGVVAILWVVVSLVGGRGRTGTPAPAELASFFKDVSPATVTAVRFTASGKGTVLEKQGDEWRVEGHATDSGTVARFWKTVEEAKVGDLVASNPSNHARMGLAADSAWRIEFDMRDATRTLLVGKSGPRFQTAYVRLPDDDDVYLLEGDLRSHVMRPADEWRNRRMTVVDTSVVTHLEVTRDGKRYVLARGDSVWTLADGTAADGTLVRNMLSEVSGLRAAGFYEADDPAVRGAKGGGVLALDAEGDTLMVLTFGSGSGDRWARVAGDPEVYRLAGWRLDRVAPGEDKVRGGS